MTVQLLPTSAFLLPAAPKSWDEKQGDIKIHKALSKPIHHCNIEPAGYEFSALARRARLNRSMYEDMQLQAALDELTDDVVDDEEEEEEPLELLMRDPMKWKEQDHYQVLGLSNKRWKASDDDIKRAYRRKVLKHHPDKKAATSGNSNDDNFFKCIQKAWEILSDEKKRRQWDAVDPTFDESIPKSTLKPKEDFLTIYGECFKSNARFSVIHPVPEIGTMDSSKEEVEEFYQFWYKFQSWRSFEAEDEDDVDSASCREEKRWLERKNKAARAKRKKEDNQRITRLVDQAYKQDPRLLKFKADEKAAKEEKRLAKERAIQEELDKVRLQAEAEEAEKARLAAEEKSKREEKKKDKEMMKRAIKKEKKLIKALLKPILESANVDRQLASIKKLEAVFEGLSAPEDYEAFRLTFDGVPTDEQSLFDRLQDKNSVFVPEATSLEQNIAVPAAVVQKRQVQWTPSEIQILVKAVKLFPGGAGERWKKIAEYINLHAESSEEKTADDCIKMFKQYQTEGVSQHSRNVLQSQKSIKQVEIKEAPSQREAPVPWTNDEQRALEKALKQHPPTNFTANPSKRWEAVAEVVGRTVGEVKDRVRELSKKVQAK